MGIQGIYRELGPGRRVSLAKLAAESLETKGRPLRLAIDIAIWQFQIQAARGGTNPAVRTLFYRLVRLLGTPVQPVFVFDGPKKPKFKRNKRSGNADGVAVAQAKRLIELFGFVAHDAPGEAEAECAYLQKNGVVDAVLSEDVDTIMFGCTRTLRNWSAEGGRSTVPTHVSVYDVREMDPAVWDGLGRQGMVLVALMSGGDYLPEGVPGCGVKTACEAARGGFGAKLCRLKAADKDGVQRWREELRYELRTNEKGYFRTRHMKLAIPDDFPDMEILRYYTHPVVSTPDALDAVMDRLSARQEIRLKELREFANKTMDWAHRGGALKFIRTMSRGLLVHRLQQGEPGAEDLVQAITLRRSHADCDGEPEMRLAYVPGEVVDIDLSQEVEPDVSYGRGGLALNSDDEFDVPLSSGMPGSSQAADGGVVKVAFDPTKRELAWVLESVARKAVPNLVCAFELKQAAKQAIKSKAKSPKAKGAGRARKPAPVTHGSIERYTRVSKPSSAIASLASAAAAAASSSSSSSSSSKKVKDAIAAAAVKENLLQPPRATSKHRPPAAANARDSSLSSSPIPRRPRAAAAEPVPVVAASAPGPRALDAGGARGDGARGPAPEAAQDALAGDGRFPASVRAILSQGGEPKGVARPTTTTTTTTMMNRKTAREKDNASRTLVQASMDLFTQVVAPSSSQPGHGKQDGGGDDKHQRRGLEGTGETKNDDDDDIIILISDDDEKDAPCCIPSSGRAQEKARHTASTEENQEERQDPQEKNKETARITPARFQEIQEKTQDSQEKGQEKRDIIQERYQESQDKIQEIQKQKNQNNQHQKKTLLVPDACGSGFKEILVSEGERDARIRQEERRLARAGYRTRVVRLSEVGFLDLSGE